ncbi:MAG: proline hydroxylase [Pseudanabaena sp.]|nr:MAG: proline hydroxylase [Pseudanabaena sp.]
MQNKLSQLTEQNKLSFIDLNQFEEKGKGLHETYINETPFPHIVIDDFLPEDILSQVLDEFARSDQIDWVSYNNPRENKLGSVSESQLGDATRLLLYQLSSSMFLNFLEALTGIKGLIADPHFQGAGLHQIKPGGFMKIHADYNHLARLNLEHRVNLLLYLNKDWKEEYGGHFELWDRDMSSCQKKVLPIFNRCVIFTSTDTSYHGHPNPLTCPCDRTRRSLAVNYYTATASVLSTDHHQSLWKVRPGEKLPVHIHHSREFTKRITPPILLDAWRTLIAMFNR